jgi:hypothetical protein
MLFENLEKMKLIRTLEIRLYTNSTNEKELQAKSMNNPSNLKMQSFLLSMKNAQCNFRVKQKRK